VCRAVRAIKAAVPQIGVLCDVALDPYTSHGHDGVLRGDDVHNDSTVEILVQQALVQVAAGCDIIAPSDMMDGRVGAIRRALDTEDLTDVSIMGKTTDATPKEIGPNQLLGGIVLNVNTTMGFRVSLVAHNTTTHAPVGRIVLEGIINRVGSVSTTNIFGTVTKVVNDANLAGLDANATANVTAGALKIMVTGIAATNLNWVGRVSLEEVGG